MSIDANGKRRQSLRRNDDTKFINALWRENERKRLERSNRIREDERLARACARSELEQELKRQ